MGTPDVIEPLNTRFGQLCCLGVETKTTPTGLDTVGLGSLSVRGGTDSKTSSKTLEKDPLVSDWDVGMSPRGILRKTPSG
jgi:hypothetical protein